MRRRLVVAALGTAATLALASCAETVAPRSDLGAAEAEATAQTRQGDESPATLPDSSSSRSIGDETPGSTPPQAVFGPPKPDTGPFPPEQPIKEGVALDLGDDDFSWKGDVGSPEEIASARSAVTSLMSRLFKAREIPSPEKRASADPSRSAERAAADYRSAFSPDAPEYMKYRIEGQAKATANAWTDNRVGGFTNSSFAVEAWLGTRVETDGRIVVLMHAHYVVDLNRFHYDTYDGFVEAPGRKGLAIQDCTYRVVITSVKDTPAIQRLDVRNCDGG